MSRLKRRAGKEGPFDRRINGYLDVRLDVGADRHERNNAGVVVPERRYLVTKEDFSLPARRIGLTESLR